MTEDKPKTKFVAKWLPIPITETQLVERARAMGQHCKERDDAMKAKAEHQSMYTKKIKELDGSIAKLTEVIRTGIDHDNVECEERFDYSRNIVETYRLDTNEIIDRRDMHRWERQEELNLGAEQAAAMEKEDNHEGQTSAEVAEAALASGNAKHEIDADGRAESWQLTK